MFNLNIKKRIMFFYDIFDHIQNIKLSSFEAMLIVVLIFDIRITTALFLQYHLHETEIAISSIFVKQVSAVFNTIYGYLCRYMRCITVEQSDL